MPVAIEQIAYSPRTGRYIYTDTKRFVPDAVIRNLVDTEQQQLGVRLQALTRLLDSQKIDLGEWQTRFAQTLKDAHLRMLTLGAGGQSGLTPRHYGAVGYQLSKQYEFLDRFARQISGGKVTVAQALRRSKMYAASIRTTFGKSQQLSRIDEQFTEAKRTLDPQAAHCASCIRHSTKGKWVAIASVTVPGVDCECGQFCKCQIYYRRRSRRAPLTQAGILGQNP